MKIKYLFFILLLSFIVNSCDVYSTMASYDWHEFELIPSKIVTNGSEFFSDKLSNGNTFSVYYDKEIAKDENYYYVHLVQDFGWTSKDENTWSIPYNARRFKLGYIYINSKSNVAIYFYPKGSYNVFKVNIVK